MRTSEAARYARWAAYVAFLLLAAVGMVYVHRAWQARQVRKSAPPAVPATVQQQSAQFSFSKVEENRTIFTVRASRATEFKEGNKNLLEDVWITIYGRTGARFDNIHTQSCDYLSDTGRVVCAGEVQIDLESAEEASQRPGERVLHVATRRLSFDRESGQARSDQPVVFRFPYGQGRALGVSYSSRDAVIRLLRDVELTLASPPPAKTPAGKSREAGKQSEPLKLTAGSLLYRRDDHTLRLLAPVHAQQGNRELVAGEVALELAAELRARRLIAGAGQAAAGQPELRLNEPGGRAVLWADQFVALFHPEGWTERVLAVGKVRGRREGPAGEDRLTAERIEAEMLPRGEEAHWIEASGNVNAQSSHGATMRHLETSALRLFFVAGRKPGTSRLDHGETSGPATIEWNEPATDQQKTVTVNTRLRAQQAAAEFGDRNQLLRLTGRNGVEVERRWPDRLPQLTTSREFSARFAPGGLWAEVEQSGDVRFREGDRTAQADHARLARATDSVTLTGSVVLADPVSRTTAPSVSFNQRTGEMQAEGDVRTSYLSAERKGAPNLAPQPAHITSGRLLANTASGRAVYSGRARLWQGDAVIEADSIELLREPGLLNARGNVFTVFPQAPGSPAGLPGSSSRGGAASQPARTEPGLWRIRAGTLTYWTGEARALLEQNVLAQSRQSQITSRALELFFARAGSAGPSAGASTGGAQQLTRAVASGSVTVRQGERRGTAERAEYTAAEEKFVLSGGHPTLYDASRGTTTGRQLTFYFASDTIVVDSEEGTRTLTRHRVEK